MHVIINGRIILPDKVLDGCALLFEEKITGVVSRETLATAWQNAKCWKGKPLTLTDAQGAYVSPGFINLHIHGCAGADTMDAEKDTLSVMSRFLVQTGVTSFLPTTMTYDVPSVYKALERIRKNMTRITRRQDEKHELLLYDNNPVNETVAPDHCLLPGAKVLGAYLEGPFISSAYKGAQKEEFIIPADFSYFQDFADVIKVIVLAPETLRQDPERMRAFTRQCKEYNIILSLGHSAATYDVAKEAINAGATHVTHLCNAMTGLHHRNPGLVGAAMDSHVTCELIADDLHVHPAVQRIIYKNKDVAELELVTDSIRACGMPEGVSELGGQTVYVQNGEARLADGTLAGSVVTLNRAMENFRKNTGATVPEVVRMATENQAQELGLFEKIGSLSPGAAADVTVFDEKFRILHTFVDGREVYKKPDFR
jgi:N-acetylglucosamine-6-phosphate deacetylase